MHIDQIRKLSLEYASGNAPKKRKVSRQLRTRHNHKIDIQSLATRLVDPAGLAIRESILRILHLTYTEYIRTSHWRNFRFEFIHRLPSTKCEITFCTRPGIILHHRSYARLGCESFDDVFYACHECHDKIHKEIRRIKKSKRRNREILGGLKMPTRSLADNRTVHTEPVPTKYKLPWGGLFARRLVTA